MRLVCPRNQLLTAFQLAGAFVAGRDNKPVLHSVKTVVENGSCILEATNLEVGIRLELTDLPAEVPGAALLPASKIISILRESPDEQLTIESAANGCFVRGQTAEFELVGEDPNHFPDLPTMDTNRFHEVGAGQLRDMIRKCLFAAAQDSPRFALTGVLWELEGATVRLVATDGRRLAVTEGPAAVKSDKPTKGQTHVIPTKAMHLLERNLHNHDESVRVSLRSNDAIFQTERTTIWTRLVEGQFPAYRDVIPKKPVSMIDVPVGPFHAAVRQAAVMTDQDSPRVVFHFAAGKLVLQAQGVDAGRSKVETAIGYAEKPLEIAFNPHFLTDFLRVLNPEDTVKLEISDGSRPVIFRTGASYIYVVVPLAR